MNEDELSRGIEGWAAATDPDADPISADEVLDLTGPPSIGSGPRRPRRWLAVAAAVLVVAGLAGAVAVVGSGDDGSDVATDGGGGAAPSTQIVVAAPDVSSAWWDTVNRLVIWGPCEAPRERCPDRQGPALAVPLEPGTSLAVERPLVSGRWLARIETYECVRGGFDSCGPPRADGRPGVEVEPAVCEMPLDVPPAPARIVIEVATASGGPTACAATDPSLPVPELTVPPAWSVRPDLPWSCGAATWDINGQIAGSDAEGAVTTLDCFHEAVVAGTPVEIPVPELTPGDGLDRRWWRVLPEPVGGKRVEVFRDIEGEANGWTRAYCDDVEVETTETEDGDGVFRAYVGADLAGCTDEEALPLDLPPLDEAVAGPATSAPTSSTVTTPVEPSSPPTTVAPGGAPVSGPEDTVDVVLDVTDPPPVVEAGTRRWTVTSGGEDVRSGPLTEGGTIIDGTGEPEVQLVADDLPAAVADAALAVRIDDFDCTGAEPQECRADSMGPRPGATTDGGCTAQAPVPRRGAVLVVTLRSAVCQATWADARPALTVPPAWSLRRTGLETCGELDADDRWAQCLADVMAGADGSAEWTERTEGVRTTYVVVDGVLTVFRRSEEPGGAWRWTTQTCSGLFPGPTGRSLAPESCGDEADMPLQP